MKVEQGWCSSGGSCPTPLWPGFEFRDRRHMWVELVAASLPFSKRFSPELRFSSKTNLKGSYVLRG